MEIGNGRRARVAAPDAGALSMILDHTVHIRQLNIQQALDMRRTLELRTASLTALRRSDAEARELKEITERMLNALNAPDGVTELDILFHKGIARASGSPLCAMMVASFRVVTRQTGHIGRRSRANAENRAENIRCHQRIGAAIMAQDPGRAEAAIAEHFDSATVVLLRAGVT
ncbi:MAG: GntR family transcriptional repressor for pyruvate dehydrogenase complex [Paracoccaceae bacterium]